MPVSYATNTPESIFPLIFYIWHAPINISVQNLYVYRGYFKFYCNGVSLLDLLQAYAIRGLAAIRTRAGINQTGPEIASLFREK